MALKTEHSTTSTSSVMRATKAVYWTDFATGSGAGSAQLEMQLDLGGSTVWVPADTAVTDTMGKALEFDLNTPFIGNGRPLRWNVTRAAGTIITYIDVIEGQGPVGS